MQENKPECDRVGTSFLLYSLVNMKISEKYDLQINEVAYSGEFMSLSPLMSSEICNNVW
jgi:hypothetical protein